MKTKLTAILLVLSVVMAFGQVGRINIDQQIGNRTGDLTKRAVVPAANDLLGFDANKKLVSITPATALSNASGVTTTSNPIQHEQVALTAAQINGMYATPVLLVAGAGSGKAIIVTKLAFTITRTSTQFANGGAVIFQYGNTTHGGGVQALDSTAAATVVTGSAGTTVTIRNGAVISDSSAVLNISLYISNATGAFDTGTGTAVVDVWYYKT